ncbi:MAG TPA: hypothetical protein PKV16_00595 [Caldisericia bacterium]|nr:hypothetical protein [Caldisericia bacterium]HPF49090.1 hypothetical protein [Caldisericia bacterium]HPI83046.1 hypothetical protein [Caldisericia bacterium]HPQ92273.1 hypothetical protein [Caldisericia bacterium]HRV74629.1 hypothetical protein [Caldisericia bacterium]
MNKNKLTTIFVAAILLLSPLEFSFASDLSMHNETATMVAVRWAPVGMSWSGNNLVSAPDYNFDGNSIVSWGRTSFPMPDAEFAIDTNSYNIAATDTTNTIPLYYCVFYLNLDYDYQTPTRMKEKMFAVIDSAGQIWFDPDGNFNDCRYYGYSDPNDPNYRRDPVANVDWDDVRINKNCYVDPINGNNTQGPYYLFPTKQDGSSQPGYLTDTPVYFRWDTEDLEGFYPTPLNPDPPIKTRLFQLGWVDMPDFPLIQDKNPSIDFPLIQSLGTTLKPRAVSNSAIFRWDIGLQLSTFEDNGDADFTVDEEWHAENISTEGRYTPSEWIYKRTDATLIAPNVASSDTRLTDVVLTTSIGTTRIYKAGTQVVDNPPFGILDPGDDLDVGQALIPFVNTGSTNDERYSQNVDANSMYDPGEFIYRKLDSENFVTENDVALTDVNTNAHRFENTNGAGVCSIGGCVAGDMLLLVETIKSGPIAPIYDYFVQSDVWMGNMPSSAKAGVYNPYGKSLYGSQSIAKSTSLDETSLQWALPAVTFFNIKPDYRSYYGIALFNDNGLDNSFGTGSDVTAQNANVDYYVSRNSEAFIGAIDVLECPDAYRTTPPPTGGPGLVSFDSRYKRFDDGSPTLGCNRKLYMKGTGSAMVVEAGDKRLFVTTVIRDGSEVTYKCGSTVAKGDLDVGTALANLPPDLCFYDIRHDNDMPDGEYTPGEDIYLDTNSNLIVDYGDVRMSDMVFDKTEFNCGDVVDELGVWVHKYELHGVSTGNCGYPMAIDVPVLPGNLGLTVHADRYLRVEQTSKLTVKTAVVPRNDNKIHVVVTNMVSQGKTPHEQYFVLTKDKPEAEIEITPYRGSLNLNGTYDPITITAYAEFGDYNDLPEPPDGAYQDLFYLTKYYNEPNLKNPPQLTTTVPKPVPITTVPLSIHNSYDAWDRAYHSVTCEYLEMASTRLCLDQLEERFPNISLEAYNGDNVSDINDPCCIPFALGSDQHTIVLFNAIGGGVKWMATAIGSSGQRYIIQYNQNKTYKFWYWNDIGYVPGALDAGDFVGDDPAFFPPNPIGTQMPIEVSTQASLDDMDDSARAARPSLNDDGFMKWGVVTKGDHLGIFDGEMIDPKTGSTFGEIWSWGVPTYITSRGTFTETDVGGWALGIVKPIEPKPVKLRLTSFNIMWDYNSVRDTHPAEYIMENHLAMDYTGYVTVDVPEVDARLNFSELQIVDRGLQFSNQNYTNGEMATNPLPFPAPQIQLPYNPILRNLQDEFRAYPGGQTHIGRVFRFSGGSGGHGMRGLRALLHGFSAYPAIWSEWGQRYNKSSRALGKDRDADKAQKKVNYVKLGTEFGPLTDYAFYFVLKDMNGRHLTFNPGTAANPTPSMYHIQKIKVTGPFKTPPITDPIEGYVTTKFSVDGRINSPLGYDFTGEIVIDNTNYKWYEYEGKDFIGEVGFGPDTVVFDDYDYNGFLMWNHRLNYTGIDNVIKIDELIPLGSGEIQIEVTLSDGTIKHFQDCCDKDNTYGVQVHGLTITGLPETLAVNQDHHLDVQVTEDLPMQVEMACNNAVLFIWQDRGIAFQIEGMDEPLHIGQGDARMLMPPMPVRDSSWTGAAMYTEFLDFNDNGKVSFGDWEIEVIGTYDLASNTWVGGMVDGRTVNRNNGIYHFDLTADGNCQITDVGIDIGGFNIGRMSKHIIERDHVVAANETAGVYVDAFKYGDDNSDRSFAPYYQFEWFDAAYTHEVYLAGQARVNVQPADSLNIEVYPQPLTAGIVNELVDPTAPLTIKVMDANGSPINLLEGVIDLIGDRDVPPERAQQHLFRDWHPDQAEFYGPGARLPQYYWVRTDLHNESGDYYENFYLYSNWEDKPFDPIDIDFSRADEGLYMFKGFCANDAGEFDLTVYTPDRRSMGTTKVKVELPDVEYSVVNIDDPEQKVFTSPGEPDFLLTAGSNRIYDVTVTCRNKQGVLIKQPPQSVRMCNEYETFPAHFTPFISLPANQMPRKWFPCYDCEEHYDVHVGFDYSGDGIVQRGNGEIYTFQGAKSRREFMAWDDEYGAPTVLRYNSPVYYNTRNVYFRNSTFSETPSMLIEPDITFTDSAWGLGCIYNQPYDGVYLFADREIDGVIDYDDFLALDELGSCKFTIFAEDVCKVGGLVGCNPYTADRYFCDVAGAPLPYYTDPGFVYTRYKFFTEPGPLRGSDMGSRDGTFKLDWDAMPSSMLQIAPPKIVLKSARTGRPLSAELFDPSSFDLAYGCNNYVLAELHPADDRDLVMPSGATLIASGSNHHELSQGGFINWMDSEVPITHITITPDGHGKEVIYLGYKNKNTLLDVSPYDFNIATSPRNYSIFPIASLDSSPGIMPVLVEPAEIVTNLENDIVIKVVDVATGALIENAKVRITSDEIDLDSVTKADGKASFKLTPKNTETLLIVATAEGYVEGECEIRPGVQTQPPMLEIDEFEPVTNKKISTISGTTTPGAKITVNGNTVAVDSDGNFKTTVTLVEGSNSVQIISSLNGVPPTTKNITVFVDTIPPAIMPPRIPELIGAQKYTLKVRIEPGCQATVNGQKATVIYDQLTADISLTPGNNEILIEAVDPAGNIARETLSVPVYAQVWAKLVVGEKLVVDEEGNPLGSLTSVFENVQEIPVDALQLIFNASYTIRETISLCELEIFGNTYAFEAGSTSAIAGGQTVELPTAPILRGGMFYLSPEVLLQVLDCEVEYNTITGELVLSRLWLP